MPEEDKLELEPGTAGSENPNPITDADYRLPDGTDARQVVSGEVKVPDVNPPAPVDDDPIIGPGDGFAGDGGSVSIISAVSDSGGHLLTLAEEGYEGYLYFLSPTDPYGMAPRLRVRLAAMIAGGAIEVTQPDPVPESGGSGG